MIPQAVPTSEVQQPAHAGKDLLAEQWRPDPLEGGQGLVLDDLLHQRWSEQSSHPAVGPARWCKAARSIARLARLAAVCPQHTRRHLAGPARQQGKEASLGCEGAL